ncbi:hypothetical protein V8E36_009257 [Tilletia maclaganii]
MTTLVNEKNELVNEEGLPFFDPVEAVAPGDPKASKRTDGLVLPFVRQEADGKRTKAERAKWMEDIFSQLEEEEERELAREEEELEDGAQRPPGSKRREEGARSDSDGEEEREDKVDKAGRAAKGTSGAAQPAPKTSFTGLKKGFLNSRPKAAAITTPSGPLDAAATKTIGVSSGIQVKERQPGQHPAPQATEASPTLKPSIQKTAPAPASAKPKQPQKRVGFKSDLVQEKIIPGRDDPLPSTSPFIGSRLRFEDLSIADAEADGGDEEKVPEGEEEDDVANDDDDDDELGVFDDDDEWDSDEGYDSDDLADLAPDLDADIDNAELAREYARARAGLLQSRALDEARRSRDHSEQHGAEDIVPLDASIADPSVRSSGPRVSRFRASRLARAVNDFDTLLQDSKSGERNPLLVVPDLAPIRYPRNGELVDPSQPGVVVDNVDLDGESDEDDERLHEVMKARLLALEEQETVAGVSKTVVERTAPTLSSSKAVESMSNSASTTAESPPIAETSQKPAKSSDLPSVPGPRKAREPTRILPREPPMPDDIPPRSQTTESRQGQQIKEVRFEGVPDQQNGISDASEQATTPVQPKVSRFKARKMAERGPQ